MAFPPAAQLRELSAADVGNIMLPGLLGTLERPNGFVPRDWARSIAEREYKDEYIAERQGQKVGHTIGDILMEGFAFLERAGLIVPVGYSSDEEWKKLSRAGERAARSSSVASTAVSSLEANRLLHPRISKESLRELERGPEGYDSAIFKAFKEVEIAVRSAAGLPNDRIGVDLMNAAFNPPNGVLVDQNMNASEQRGLRDVFAGAILAFKNPSSHRIVGEDDPYQVMRLLVYASALLEIVERSST